MENPQHMYYNTKFHNFLLFQLNICKIIDLILMATAGIISPRLPVLRVSRLCFQGGALQAVSGNQS